MNWQVTHSLDSFGNCHQVSSVLHWSAEENQILVTVWSAPEFGPSEFDITEPNRLAANASKNIVINIVILI